MDFMLSENSESKEKLNIVWYDMIYNSALLKFRFSNFKNYV
jgi:hypothetical protein